MVQSGQDWAAYDRGGSPAQSTQSLRALAQGWQANRLPAFCPLWVNSRHGVSLGLCPLYPSKRTKRRHVGMSALCRKAYASLCDFRAKRLNKVGMPYQPFDPKNETFGRA